MEDSLLVIGSFDQAKPPIRSILVKVLQAIAIIVGHNDPSGAAEASESDRLFTEDPYAALKSIGVRLLDHMVIGFDSDFSFADKGLMG